MMKTLLLLVVSVLSVNAGFQDTRSCYGRCGEDSGACSCGSHCGSLSRIDCCSDYRLACGLLYRIPSYPISRPPIKSCSNPSSIANGFIIPGYNVEFDVGDSVSYSCQDGYKLVWNQVCTASSDFVSKPHWVPAQKPECQRSCNGRCGEDSGACSCGSRCASSSNIGCCDDYESLCEFYNPLPNRIRTSLPPIELCSNPGSIANGSISSNQTKFGVGDSVSYSCRDGYKLDGVCNQVCTTSSHLVSKPHWVPAQKPECQRIDPCENHLCHKYATCMPNHNGVGYTCKCKRSYFGDGFICKKPCDDHNCHPMATCYGSGDGSYTCECNTGYEGSGKMCNEMYPCDSNPCDPNANCTNVDTKRYKCDCIAGYTGDGKFCKKIDPCENHLCHRFATCMSNHNGVGYTCQCNCGYFGDGFVCKKPCDDHKCHPMATCYGLLDGNYLCQCNKGYEGSGKMCKPINPCNFAECHEHSTCHVVDGQPVCKCVLGYSLGIGGKCNKIYPCVSSPCDPHAICTNINMNQYSCECKDGYIGNGKCCKKMFPCDSNPCGAHTTCVNVGDSYKCVSVSGYFRAGLHDCRRCQVPEFIDNGKFRPFQRTYPVGSTVTYTCDDGYELKGSRIRRCQANEKFSGYARCDHKS